MKRRILVESAQPSLQKPGEAAEPSRFFLAACAQEQRRRGGNAGLTSRSSRVFKS